MNVKRTFVSKVSRELILLWSVYVYIQVYISAEYRVRIFVVYVAVSRKGFELN